MDKQKISVVSILEVSSGTNIIDGKINMIPIKSGEVINTKENDIKINEHLQSTKITTVPKFKRMICASRESDDRTINSYILNV